MLAAIGAGSLDRAAGLLCNVLEGVTVRKHAIIDSYKQTMLQQGALASMMSGSGPTVFGLAGDEASAGKIAAAIRALDAGAAVYVAKTVV